MRSWPLLDHHQDGEDDDADDEIPGHDEIAEGLDHIARFAAPNLMAYACFVANVDLLPRC
jgi:hypothetical protein